MSKRAGRESVRTLLVVCAACAWAAGALAAGPTQRFAGQVVGVSDGDTVSVLVKGRAAKVRLEGVDCPELSQDYGRVAKLFTSEHAFGKRAEVTTTTTDRYGRIVGRVVINGEDLGKALLAAGLAWHYTDYSTDRELDAIERDARRRRVGIWSQANPMPPWVYRRGSRSSATGAAGRPQTPGRPSARSAPRGSAPIATGPFHGNVKSRVFHAPGCPNYNCRQCTAVFATAGEAIAQGYKPARDCPAGR